MKTKRIALWLGALLLPCAFPVASMATTATATFAVTATVLSTCIIAALPLAFGNYAPGPTPLNATTTVTVTCTSGTTYNVGLNAGTGSGATVTLRKMTSGANTLGYTIWQDSAHTINWGNTVGTDTVSGTGNGLAQALTAYGQIPANEFSPAGAYTDTVTATVTY